MRLHLSITNAWPLEKVALILRRAYDDVLDQPVPQDMLDLLRRLK